MIEYIKFFSDVLSNHTETKAKREILVELVLHEAKCNLDLLKLVVTKSIGDIIEGKTELLKKLDTSSLNVIMASGLDYETIFKSIKGKEKDIEKMISVSNKMADYTQRNCSELYEFCIRKEKVLKIIAETGIENKSNIRVSVRAKNVILALRALIEKLSK